MLGALARAVGLRKGRVPKGRKAAVGAAGEREAEAFLRRKGYRVLARNFVAPMGEADLICRDAHGAVVLVEVKTRTVEPGVVQPPPEAQITAHKQRTLRALARHLARANRWDRDRLRIDVVAIEHQLGGETELRHHVGAVQLSEHART